MPSYLITGVSRGLGWQFLTQISSDPNNTVVGLVRDKPSTDKRVTEELSDRSNITIVEADLTSYESLKKVVPETSAITGGSLDYIIHNGAYMTSWEAYFTIADMVAQPDELTDHFNKYMTTNVLGTIHLYNLFLPLIIKGKEQKVIAISSGMADADWVNNFDIATSPLYAASKAAMNMVVAKFSAQYKKDGILFLGICPGMIDTGHYDNPNPEQQLVVGGMVSKFQAYSSQFKGPQPIDETVNAVLSVAQRCSVENRDGGAFVSHFGNKRWL